MRFAFQKLGQIVPNDVIAEIIRRHDLRKDGVISFEEFRQIFNEEQLQHWQIINHDINTCSNAVGSVGLGSKSHRLTNTALLVFLNDSDESTLSAMSSSDNYFRVAAA